MIPPITKRPLVPEIASRLGRLRLYLRGYVWLQGLALAVATLGIAFWITLGLDWLFEPRVAVRIAVMAIVAALIVAVLLRQLVSRLLVPLTDRSLALLLERRYRQLGDRLLTVVELAESSPETAGFDPRMLAVTGAETCGLMGDVWPSRVFNYRPMFRSLGLAVLVAASIAALAAWRPTTFDTWVDRSLMLSARRWPRDTRVVVDGFPADGQGRRTTKVAIGGDLEVHARADTAYRIPDSLEVDYVTQDGSSLRQGMTAQGSAIPGRDPYQNFFFKFKNVQNTMRFGVLARHSGVFGKDDRVDDLWIEAVPSPELANITLRCKYPDYLKRTSESLPVTGIMAVPEGTQLVVESQASKDLVSVDCQVAGGESGAVTRHIDVPGRGRRFELPLGMVRHDTMVLYTLHDTDGVSNRRPLPLHIRAVLDEVPELDVRLSGIGKAITPRALLPLQGRITDDHGVTRAWFEYHVQDEKQPHERSFALPRDGQLTPAAAIAFDVTDLNLKSGGRLYLWVKAADAYPFQQSPHVGSTSRYELEIVTESQLRALMETTELLLRRRLEGVIAELNRSRDALGRMQSEDRDARPAGQGERSGAEKAQARSEIRVEESLQSGQRTSHETQDIAEQFERILQELQNNRVEHLDQLRSRLQDGIATPLKATVSDEFPKLQQRLKELRAALADAPQRLAAATAAQQQLDVILRQMDKVIGKMLELESFNELLAELRNIIQSNEKISNLTKERREELKKELRKGLLE